MRVYDTLGIALSDSFKVEEDDPVDNPLGRIAASRSNDGNIIIVWEDHRNDPPGILADGDIYAQRYNPLLQPIGNNIKVNHEQEERPQRDPATVFCNGNFMVAWLDDQTPEPCPPLPPGVVAQGIANIMSTLEPFDNPSPGQVLGWRTKRSRCPPPTQFALHQNYPNPFNMETKISFDVPVDAFVNIIVYDLLGRPVRSLINATFPVGRYQATLNSSGLSSGVYFYRLSTEQFSRTQKMILIK
jgi:hypothetical protein